MLSFRLILTIAAAGIALWGLFSLLENLNEPALLRSADRAAVKGCATLDSEATQQQCPPLLCQKALFDAKSFSQHSTLRITADTTRGAERLVAVSASESAGAPAAQFVCIMQRDKVLLSRRASDEEIQRALAAGSDWSKQLSATIAP